MSSRSGLGLGMLILVGIILFSFFIDICSPSYGFIGKVGTGEVGIVTRFGKVKEESLPEGRCFKGFFDKITTMSIRVQKKNYAMSAFSKDIQQVDTQIAVNFQVDGETASNLFKTIGVTYDEIIITPAVAEGVKTVYAHYTAEQLIECRSELSDKIVEELTVSLQPYGIIIRSVSVIDIDFTDAFTDAVEAKQVATQTKLKAQTEQERLTIEKEAEAERQVIEAEAEAEAIKAKADAEAYAIRVKAEAEASGNKEIASSITDALIDYTYALGWNGVLPTTIMGETDGVIPVLAN